MRRSLTTCVAAALLLAGCQGKPAETTAGGAAPSAGDPAAPKPIIAVVPKAVTHQFWTTVKAGADKAAAEHNALVEWKGPDKETDIAGQKAIIEDFVTRPVQAIVMAACDAEALVPTIKEAEAAGIPVITIDSGVNYDKIRSHVATDNVAAAQTAGETLFKLIGADGGHVKQFEVGLIPFVKGAASSEDREQGFRQAATANKSVKLVSTLYSDSEITTASNVTTDMLQAHPNLAGIFAANEAGAIGAANAINEAGREGEVKLVGFDGSPDQVKLLRAGVIQALVVQQPFRMGYEGVMQALKAIKGEQLEPRIDTGVLVVTKENVDKPEVQAVLNPK